MGESFMFAMFERKSLQKLRNTIVYLPSRLKIMKNGIIEIFMKNRVWLILSQNIRNKFITCQN